MAACHRTVQGMGRRNRGLSNPLIQEYARVCLRETTERVPMYYIYAFLKQVANGYCVYHLNIFRGFDFFLPLLFAPPRPPPRPPPPRPRRRLDGFLNGAKPTFCPGESSIVESPCSVPATGAIRGRRYFGICFMCDWTRMGCNGLSCRRYSRSSGLSSKCAYNPTSRHFRDSSTRGLHAP